MPCLFLSRSGPDKLSREELHEKPMAIPCLRKIGKTTCSATLLLLVFFLGSSSLGAQSKSLSADKRAQVEKAASSFMATNSVPGISVAVVQDGALVWSQGFGMADLESLVPAASLTLFRLGSISKPITATAATAIRELSERGKLDLDVEVQKYCPAFPKKEWPITTRELLGHLGGIRHYNPDGKGDIPADSAKHFLSMEESLQIFAGDALVTKPGTKFTTRRMGTRFAAASWKAPLGRNTWTTSRKTSSSLRGWPRRRVTTSSPLFPTARAGTTRTSPESSKTRGSGLQLQNS
jgi:hypothetical protein